MKLLSLFVGLWLLTACTYERERELIRPLDPNAPVLFGRDIQPILNANCVSCHNNGIQNDGINLEIYAGVKAAIDAGRLLRAVDHTGPKRMPQGGNRLPQSQIDQIARWIAQGAPNN